jgi:hypothetical protein
MPRLLWGPPPPAATIAGAAAATPCGQTYALPTARARSLIRAWPAPPLRRCGALRRCMLRAVLRAAAIAAAAGCPLRRRMRHYRVA